MPADPPVKRRAVAQHRIHVTRDPCPVLGADVPAAAEVIRGDIVGRSIPRVDRGQNFDSGSDLRSWGQTILRSFKTVAPAKAGVQGWQTRFGGPGFPLARERRNLRVNGPAGNWGLRG